MSSRAAVATQPTLLAADAAADKDIGGREHDEDAVLLRADLGLFAVADGAGGENAGNVASMIALASLTRHYEATARAAARAPLFDRLGLPMAARRLSAAIHRANREVLDIARSSDRYRGMGTTIVALTPDLVTGVVHIAHVGDSRCYRLRSGRLELLTQDHSLAQDVLELSPEIDDKTAAKLPQNVITRALGMSETVRVSVRTLDLAVGDRFVLCSDGLTDVLSDEEIAETLVMNGNVREQCAALVSRAHAAPADDNVAAVVVLIDAAPGVVSVPKRHATRPRPAEVQSYPPPDASAQDPEIIVIDSEPPSTSEPSMHVVPAGAAHTASLSALQQLVIPRPRGERGPLGKTWPGVAPPNDEADAEEVEEIVDDDEHIVDSSEVQTVVRERPED